MKKFDWTTGFSLHSKAYEIDYQEDKVELVIPVFNASKKDIEIKPFIYGRYNTLKISIPDTKLSESRELAFEAGEDYDVKKAKANVRDGMLFIHIPFREKSKPLSIEIT